MQHHRLHFGQIVLSFCSKQYDVDTSIELERNILMPDHVPIDIKIRMFDRIVLPVCRSTPTSYSMSFCPTGIQVLGE